MTNENIFSWIIFGTIVFAMLVIDLGVAHRKTHEVKVREALIWSAIWIVLSLIFNIGVYYTRGADDALKFLTGYLLEKSLSVDNLFVFLLIFKYFHVAPAYQHKILFWGILGAVFMRAIFIAAGVTLIHRFHAIIYFFGAFLIFTGIKLALDKDKKIDPSKNIILRLFYRFMPVAKQNEEGKFFVRHAGKLTATPIFIVLIVVETTDVVFAIDSIPAILGVTTDPFIIYTSNIFAILGLRALYFALAGIMKMFHHLHHGLAAILIFIGLKMLASDFIHVPVELSLTIIALIFVASVAASLIWPGPATDGVKIEKE